MPEDDVLSAPDFRHILAETEHTFGNLEFVCEKHGIPRATYVKYRRAFSTLRLTQLIFPHGSATPAIDSYAHWLDRSRNHTYESNPSKTFKHPRWRMYEITGRLLADLHEGLDGVELSVGGDRSFFGDGGDRTVQAASAAIWLCANVGLFVREVAARCSQSPSPQDPLGLIRRIYDVLAIECQGLANDEALAVIARLLLAIGVGVLPPDTDWARHLEELVELQLESTSGSGYEKPVIRWALQVETAENPLSLDERNASFQRLMADHQETVARWQLNNWAYFFVGIGLYRPATPMARIAVERRPWAGAFDTFGWALFHERKLRDADRYVGTAIEQLSVGDKVWFEAQYHRAQIAYWSDRMSDVVAIITDMQAADMRNQWTQRATELKALVPNRTAPQSHSRQFDYDVAISYAAHDRGRADELSRQLTAHGVRVFYDEFSRASLWGKDLLDELSDIYEHRARFCVLLVSKYYAKSRWTTLERRAAVARALVDHEPYILPIQLDETEVPDIRPAVGRVWWEKEGVGVIVNLIIEKLQLCLPPGSSTTGL